MEHFKKDSKRYDVDKGMFNNIFVSLRINQVQNQALNWEPINYIIMVLIMMMIIMIIKSS